MKHLFWGEQRILPLLKFEYAFTELYKKNQQCLPAVVVTPSGDYIVRSL